MKYSTFPIYLEPHGFEYAKKTTYPFPKQPSEINHVDLKERNNWLSVLLVAGGFIFTVVNIVKIETGGLWIIGLLICGIGFLVEKWEESIYQKNYKKWENSLIAIHDHSKKMDQFRNECEYINKHQNFLNKQIQEEKLLNEIRRSTAHKISNEIVLKGITEDYFYDFLNHFFKSKIHRQCALISTYTYYPDFMYFDDSTKLRIDIEIDEPYTLTDFIPLHFYEKNIHIDEYRNNEFLSANWLVIRFAEEQIINQPIECCEFIAMKIADLLGDYYLLHDFKKFKTSNLQEVACWSKDDIFLLRLKRYREKYLSTKKEFSQFL